MVLLPIMLNRIPGCDPIFAEVNMTADGYYEIGGISEVEMGADGYYHSVDVYQTRPHYTGSPKKIAREIFVQWINQDPIFRQKEMHGWPITITLYPRTSVKFSYCAIPTSRNQKTDLDKFLAEMTVEFDRLRILLPFL